MKLAVIRTAMPAIGQDPNVPTSRIILLYPLTESFSMITCSAESGSMKYQIRIHEVMPNYK